MTEKLSRNPLPAMFNAEAIAMVGASNNVDTMGSVLLMNKMPIDLAHKTGVLLKKRYTDEQKIH